MVPRIRRLIVLLQLEVITITTMSHLAAAYRLRFVRVVGRIKALPLRRETSASPPSGGTSVSHSIHTERYTSPAPSQYPDRFTLGRVSRVTDL